MPLKVEPNPDTVMAYLRPNQTTTPQISTSIKPFKQASSKHHSQIQPFKNKNSQNQ